MSFASADCQSIHRLVFTVTVAIELLCAVLVPETDVIYGQSKVSNV